MSPLTNVILLSFLLSLIGLSVSKTITKENCEVCVTFLEKFVEGADKERLTSIPKITADLEKKCSKSKGGDERFCYAFGGSENSATSIIKELAQFISWTMPAEKICAKLVKKDAQICDFKYEKKLDLATINIQKLKVKDLKAILSDWNESCKGCTEKHEFVKMVESLMEKHDPTAYSKRRAEL